MHFKGFYYALKRTKKNEERNKTLARPIKETPMLYGEEALQFEMRMMDPLPISPEMLESIMNDYEFMRSRCVNCSF